VDQPGFGYRQLSHDCKSTTRRMLLRDPDREPLLRPGRFSYSIAMLGRFRGSVFPWMLSVRRYWMHTSTIVTSASVQTEMLRTSVLARRKDWSSGGLHRRSWHIKPTTQHTQEEIVRRFQSYTAGRRQLRISVEHRIVASRFLASVVKAAYLWPLHQLRISLPARAVTGRGASPSNRPAMTRSGTFEVRSR
jgi:hypothetical protein